jgi:hypothetical protein
MLSRTVTSDGKSGARVDGRTVTLSVLREIAAQLVNIHGQNDNQILLSESSHIRLLDKFADNAALLSEYSEIYRECLHVSAQIDSINKDSMERERLCEMLRYQIEDIDSAKLRPGEDEALLAEVWHYDRFAEGGVWPHVVNLYIGEVMEREGKLLRTTCGDAALELVSAQDFMEVTLRLMRAHDPAVFGDGKLYRRERNLSWMERIEGIAP